MQKKRPVLTPEELEKFERSTKRFKETPLKWISENVSGKEDRRGKPIENPPRHFLKVEERVGKLWQQSTMPVKFARISGCALGAAIAQTGIKYLSSRQLLPSTDLKYGEPKKDYQEGEGFLRIGAGASVAALSLLSGRVR